MPLADAPIETERLILRAFRVADAKAACAWETDLEVMSWLGQRGPRRRARVLKEFPERVASWSGSWGALAVVSRDVDRPIGWCGLKPDTVLPDETELFYALARDWWGRGLATEASRVVLEYGFGQRGLARIIATVDPVNRRSCRVAEKLGMRLDDTTVLKHGRDHLIYFLTRG